MRRKRLLQQAQIRRVRLRRPDVATGQRLLVHVGWRTKGEAGSMTQLLRVKTTQIGSLPWTLLTKQAVLLTKLRPHRPMCSS